ncbi:hypothetical protein J437_LFUL009686, partial [Ladona fulva]
MSYHFSANQFDREFNPKRLGNWQVSKWYPERPRQRSNKTRIIADDRGHLLPGIPRFSENVQERYITAWDFPRKITRQFAEDIAKPPRWKVAAWVQEEKNQPAEEEPSEEPEVSKEPPRPSSPAEENIFEGKVPEKAEVSSQVGDKEGEASPPRSAKSGDADSGNGPPASLKSLSPIGSKTSSQSAEERDNQTETKEIGKDEETQERPQSRDSKTLGEDVVIKVDTGGEVVEGNFEEEAKEREDKMQEARKLNGADLQVTGSALASSLQTGQKDLKKQGQDGISPLATAYTPFLVAKQFAEDNLRHHPLPDM